MTGREWQPGDVARVTYSGVDRIAVVRPRKEALGERLEFAYVSRGYDMVDDADISGSARPLVVIDPEDREQVERLAKCYREVHGEAELTDEPWSAPGLRMQAALREFASPTPTKPDEPTGLGAVVEDARGALHVLTPRTREADVPEARWIDRLGDFRSWDAIDVVKVLDTGWAGEPPC